MEPYYRNDWSTGGLFLWLGLIALIFSSLGNWRYTYSAHRKHENAPRKALDILNERYAKGEIGAPEYHLIKSEIQK